MLAFRVMQSWCLEKGEYNCPYLWSQLRGGICEGWGGAQVKMPDEDCPCEDCKPLIILLPICTKSHNPQPGRQLLLDPGNGRDAVSKVMLLQVGKVAVLWMSPESSSVWQGPQSYWPLILWTGLWGLYVLKNLKRLVQKWVDSLNQMWSRGGGLGL